MAYVPLVDQTTWPGPSLSTPRAVYEASRATYAADVTAATIPVERIRAHVIVAAGGEDAVWPGDEFAKGIEARRAASGLATTVLLDPEAGHRALLPGEPATGSVADYGYGGSEEAGRRLGARKWTVA